VPTRIKEDKDQTELIVDRKESLPAPNINPSLETLEQEAKENGYIESFIDAKQRIINYKTEPNWNFKMPDSYLIALSLYTDLDVHKIINPLLRESKNQVNKYEAFLTAFINGFHFLPRYCGRCYRGTILDFDYIESHKIGSILVWKSFGSASQSKEKAKHFIEAVAITETRKAVLFTIESRSGRSLSDVSAYRNEQEIVFLPDTCFKVLSVKLISIVVRNEDISDVYHIHLLEVLSDIQNNCQD